VSYRSTKNHQTFLVADIFGKIKLFVTYLLVVDLICIKTNCVYRAIDMEKTGSLFRDIAHLIVENHVEWVPGVRGLKRNVNPPCSDCRTIRRTSSYMACVKLATCVRKNRLKHDKVERMWGKVHPDTLKIRYCHMYMISSPHDENGVILFGNGDVYKGCIKDNLVHGRGCYFFLNGDSLHGLFENGRASSGMVYMWNNTDTTFVDYKDGLVENWVQMCLDNDIYKVCGQSRISKIGSLCPEYSLTLYKTGSLGLVKRNPIKDFSMSFMSIFVD
jgi:hypothetical protein